jgi:hypothetical protein
MTEKRPVSFWLTELARTTETLQRGPSTIRTERVKGSTKVTEEHVDLAPLQNAADRGRSIIDYLIPKQAGEMTPAQRNAFAQAATRHGKALLRLAGTPGEREAVEAFLAGIGAGL